MALVIDFDGTITTKDTMGELAGYAMLVKRHTGEGIPDSAWDDIVRAYEDDYRSYARAYAPQESERTRISDELEFLRGLGAVDARSRQRVEDAGLFRGVGEFVLQRAELPFTRATQPVEIRPGFRELVAEAKQAGFKVAVISVNWSTAFIQCALKDPDIEIVANKITEDGKIVGPSGVLENDRVLSTARDKKLALDALTSRLASPPPNPKLYVGDSLTDLECLVACHGVVIAQKGSSSLMRTLSRLGVPAPFIGDEMVQAGAEEAGVYWANDFNDVLASGLLERTRLG